MSYMVKILGFLHPYVWTFQGDVYLTGWLTHPLLETAFLRQLPNTVLPLSFSILNKSYIKNKKNKCNIFVVECSYSFYAIYSDCFNKESILWKSCWAIITIEVSIVFSYKEANR